MPAITTDQGILHFEVYGKGKPVLLLHGWLGTWGLWQETMAYLGQYFRTYSLDFWGFGESGREKAACQLTDFATMVDHFMGRMGILSAPLVGHSLGGSVALLSALRYPKRVEKVVVIAAPLRASSLAFPVRLVNLKPIRFLAVALYPLTRKVILALAPKLCRDPRFREWMARDLTKTSLQRFLASAASLSSIDLVAQMKHLSIPLLGMYGDRDKILIPRESSAFERGEASAQIERWKDSGHFLMLDEPRAFMQTLKTFLDPRIE